MTLEQIAQEYPDPTEQDLASPLFEAVWQAIKDWDISRHPSGRRMYAGANGSDVMHILAALQQREQEHEAQVASLTKDVEFWKRKTAEAQTELSTAREDVKRLAADNVAQAETVDLLLLRCELAEQERELLRNKIPYDPSIFTQAIGGAE